MKEKLKVLIVEDIESDAILVQRTLKKAGLDCVFEVVEKKQQFEDALKNFNPNVILSDHSLPDFSSFAALEICKRAGYKSAFILVTGTVSEEYAVECIKQGADDY